MNQVLSDIVFHLNQAFHITPILYASFALEKVLGINLNAADIDLLIPSSDFERREHIISYFQSMGYQYQRDEVIHLMKDHISIELADEDVWLDALKINRDTLHLINDHDHSYQLLGASNLLKLYQYLSQLSHRSEEKRSKDIQKIKIIKQALDQDACRYR